MPQVPLCLGCARTRFYDASQVVLSMFDVTAITLSLRVYVTEDRWGSGADSTSFACSGSCVHEPRGLENLSAHNQWKQLHIKAWRQSELWTVLVL